MLNKDDNYSIKETQIMNALDFINSTDIKDYLKKIDYKCNQLEASWLVYQSSVRTLEEKMAAWNWIIENMDDCEVPERINCSYRKSLHESLKHYMDMLNGKIGRFYEEGTNVAYSYKYLWNGDSEWTDGEHLYSSPDICWACIEEDFDEDEISNVIEVRITREVIDNAGASVTLVFSVRKKILDVYFIPINDEEQDLSCYFFSGMWFNFPVPFEKGDVVVRFDEDKYPGHRFEEGPFVLEDITPWYIAGLDDERKKSFADGRNGDETDMNAWGHFQDEDGRIYSEAMFNYMDLELYKCPFDGRHRLLKALSNYVKGNIGVDLLMTAYRKVIIDEFADDIMLRSWYTDEGLTLAGLKNEKTCSSDNNNI